MEMNKPGFSTRNKKTGEMYYLHTNNITDKRSGYYFSKEIVGCIPLPEKYKVDYNKRGHPILRRKDG